MRHFSSQRLPAFEARHIDQTVSRMAQLLGHAVEGVDGNTDLVIARDIDALIEAAGGNFGERLREPADGTRKARSPQNHARKSESPQGGGEHDQRVDIAAAEIAPI